MTTEKIQNKLKFILMVKIHRQTGLMYLCQTTRSDYISYSGSGVYWKRHLKIHGNNVYTIVLKYCDTKEEIKKWGAHYSEMWKVVDAIDQNGNKIWANLKPEEGQGQSSETAKIINNRPETRAKNSASHKILQNDPIQKEKNSRLVKIALAKPEVKNKQINTAIESWKNEEVRKKRIDSITAAHNRPEVKKKNRDAQLIAQNREEVKKNNSIRNSGRKNARYDHKLYTFSHKDDTIERCTRHDLQIKYGLSSGHMCNLINGKLKSHKGWRLIADE